MIRKGGKTVRLCLGCREKKDATNEGTAIVVDEKFEKESGSTVYAGILSVVGWQCPDIPDLYQDTLITLTGQKVSGAFGEKSIGAFVKKTAVRKALGYLQKKSAKNYQDTIKIDSAP